MLIKSQLIFQIFLVEATHNIKREFSQTQKDNKRFKHCEETIAAQFWDRDEVKSFSEQQNTRKPQEKLLVNLQPYFRSAYNSLSKTEDENLKKYKYSNEIEDKNARKSLIQYECSENVIYLDFLHEIKLDTTIIEKNTKKIIGNEDSINIVKILNSYIKSKNLFSFLWEKKLKELIPYKSSDDSFDCGSTGKKWSMLAEKFRNTFSERQENIQFCKPENHPGFIIFRKRENRENKPHNYNYLIINENKIENLEFFGWHGSNIFIMDPSNIGKNVTINKNTYIGKNVKIGDNSFIGSYCIVEDDVEISEFACIRDKNIFEKGCKIGYCKNIESLVPYSSDEDSSDEKDNHISRLILNPEETERIKKYYRHDHNSCDKGPSVYVGYNNYFGSSSEIFVESYIGSNNYIGDNFEASGKIEILSNNYIGKNVKLRLVKIGFYNFIAQNYISKPDLVMKLFEIILSGENERYIYCYKDMRNFIFSQFITHPSTRSKITINKIAFEPFNFDDKYDHKANIFLYKCRDMMVNSMFTTFMTSLNYQGNYRA